MKTSVLALQSSLELHTTEEAAKLLRMSTRTLQRRVKDGVIAPIELGPRKHAFSSKEIGRFLEAAQRPLPRRKKVA